MTQNFNLSGAESQFKSLISRLPLLMGNEAVNFFKNRFCDQAWVDDTTQPWKARKNDKRKGGAVLVQSGRLLRSIRIVQITSDTVVIGTDVPYAEAHNEGFRGVVTVKAFKRNKTIKSTVYSTEVFNVKSKRGKKSTVKNIIGEVYVKSHSRNMNLPQRKFIGDSAVLRRNIDRMIRYEINKIIR